MKVEIVVRESFWVTIIAEVPNTVCLLHMHTVCMYVVFIHWTFTAALYTPKYYVISKDFITVQQLAQNKSKVIVNLCIQFRRIAQ